MYVKIQQEQLKYTVAADKNTKLSISWLKINIGTVTFCVDIILELLYLTLFSNSCAPT